MVLTELWVTLAVARQAREDKHRALSPWVVSMERKQVPKFCGWRKKKLMRHCILKV